MSSFSDLSMTFNPIRVIVFGQSFSEAADRDEESICAARWLERSLPTSADHVFCCGLTLTELVNAGLCHADRVELPGSALVLLLAHRNMALAPLTLARLEGTLAAGADASCAYSQHTPPPDNAPDYLTLRGLERYAQRATKTASLPCDLDGYQPLALLTSLSALRSGAWRTGTVWADGAYVHDFSGYRSGDRAEVIALVPLLARRVLDVGGGEGGFLAALKVQRGCETHLAELSALACASAAQVVDQIWQGDFLSLPLPEGFDCITFLDVLEHTVDPVAWLIRAKSLLAPNGVVVLSIPNVGHWSVVADLLEGRWDYAPAGIHCVTHLRFFTRSGIVDLLRDSGFCLESIEATRIASPDWFDVNSMNKALVIDTDNLSTYAFLAVARPL